jgi:hypothetical protein
VPSAPHIHFRLILFSSTGAIHWTRSGGLNFGTRLSRLQNLESRHQRETLTHHHRQGLHGVPGYVAPRHPDRSPAPTQ